MQMINLRQLTLSSIMAVSMYLRPDLMVQLVTFIMVQLVVLSEASMGRQVPD